MRLNWNGNDPALPNYPIDHRLLDQRDMSIVRLMSRELTYAQIGRELGLSEARIAQLAPRAIYRVNLRLKSFRTKARLATLKPRRTA